MQRSDEGGCTKKHKHNNRRVQRSLTGMNLELMDGGHILDEGWSTYTVPPNKSMDGNVVVWHTFATHELLCEPGSVGFVPVILYACACTRNGLSADLTAWPTAFFHSKALCGLWHRSRKSFHVAIIIYCWMVWNGCLAPSWLCGARRSVWVRLRELLYDVIQLRQLVGFAFSTLIRYDFSPFVKMDICM